MNPGLREDFIRGTQVARGFFYEWEPEEMVADFQRGIIRAKKISDLAYEKGWEAVGAEIIQGGDTLQLRRPLFEKEKERQFPNLYSVLDTVNIIAGLKKEGVWNGSWADRLRYVGRYHQLAVAEMLESGIPASITLAQALCESNAGKGTLAREANNHFGVKCRLKSGGRNQWEANDYFPGSIACGCLQHADDNKWDHFRVYCGDQGVADSFADHTRVLENPRYERLYGYQVSDTLYLIDKSWFGVEAVPYYAGAAAMLKAGGYATDPMYHWTIAGIIDRLQLWRIDFAVMSMLN
ncbi:MAG: glucosaminidase domain-containing protein [Saprospirales bacterium]|nr:glucosaminidase domain-containing protein [Saprospirales bacterium]